MMTHNLQKRVEDLESRYMPTNKPHPILGKCTDEELRRLKGIGKHSRNGQQELMPEEFDFLKGLEAKYGSL